MSMRGVAIGMLLSAGFVAGGIYLLGVQFSDGTVYPEYSSLRSDPVGAKLLFDTLSRVPGVTVTRDYLPLEYVPGFDATVFLLNLSPAAFDADLPQRVDKLAGRGNRVVATLAAVSAPASNTGSLAKTWHIRMGFDGKAPSELKLFFRESDGWKTIEQAGQKSRAIERTVGKGSVVLFADSSVFGNATLADTDDAGFARISNSSRPVFQNHFRRTALRNYSDRKCRRPGSPLSPDRDGDGFGDMRHAPDLAQCNFVPSSQ